MLLVVLLHQSHDELPHGGVPNILQLLRQPLEPVVVLLLPGEEAFGFGQDPLSIRLELTQIRDRGGLARELGRGSDRLGEIVEELMVASLIVQNMRSPDLLSLEEIQDNNGAMNDGTVDATATLTELAAAIQ